MPANALHWNSIRSRLTVWYTAVLAALVVTFAAGSFLVIREVLGRRADRFLRDAVLTFSEEVKAESASGKEVHAVIASELVGYRSREFDFLIFEGDRLVGRSPGRTSTPASTGEADAPLDLARLTTQLRGLSRDAVFTVGDEEGGYRVAADRLSVPPAVFSVVAAQSWHGYSETLELIAWGYGVIVPLLVLMAAAGGYWLAARSLAPVTAMSRKAASIGRENLNERVTAANPGDELGELAAVFNGMLARLEGAFEQQQRFVQDASHELRSPVAAVRAEAEVTLGLAHRSEAEYRDALAAIRRSALRLSSVVDDLFLLAQHDTRHYTPAAEVVDLGETVHDAVRSLRPVADGRNVQLALADCVEAPVRGDGAHLGRVAVNLVDNAIKYSRPGSTVHISLHDRGDTGFELRVRDEGPGIPVAAQARIFDRFFRAPPLDASPGSPAIAGAGLGLPIARMIAAAHGGRLELVTSAPTGTEFAMWLPRAGPPVDGSAQ